MGLEALHVSDNPKELRIKKSADFFRLNVFLWEKSSIMCCRCMSSKRRSKKRTWETNWPWPGIWRWSYSRHARSVAIEGKPRCLLYRREYIAGFIVCIVIVLLVLVRDVVSVRNGPVAWIYSELSFGSSHGLGLDGQVSGITKRERVGLDHGKAVVLLVAHCD